MRPTDWGRELPERRLDSEGSAARDSQHPMKTEVRIRTRAKDPCEGPVRRIGRVHIWELGRSGNLVVFLYQSLPMARGMLGNVLGRSVSRARPRLLHSPTRFLPESAQGTPNGQKGNRGTHLNEPVVLFRPIRGSYPFREPQPTADAVGYRLPVLRTFLIAACFPSPGRTANRGTLAHRCPRPPFQQRRYRRC